MGKSATSSSVLKVTYIYILFSGLYSYRVFLYSCCETASYFTSILESLETELVHPLDYSFTPTFIYYCRPYSYTMQDCDAQLVRVSVCLLKERCSRLGPASYAG